MAIRYDKFSKDFMIRNSSKINRIIDIEKIDSLPVGSVLHLLDNFKFNENIFISPDKDNILFKLLPEKKLIYNVNKEKTPLVDKYSNKINIISKGVLSALMQFKNSNKNVKYSNNPNDISPSGNVQNIFSYNSLFNTVVTGALKHYRLVNFIFANLISVINSLPETQHFINIPTDNIIFNETDFRMAMKRISVSTLKYQESSYYIFVLYILCILEKENELSIFSNFSSEVLSKVNFVMSSEKDVLVFNLEKMLALSKKENIKIRIIAAFNNLAEIGEHVKELESVPDSVKEVKPNTILPNSPAFRESPSNEASTARFKKNIKEIEQEGLSLIDNDGTLTPVQKKVLSEVAEKYKKIEIDGVSLENILNEPVNQEILPSDLPFLENDPAIVDKSMLESSVSKLGDSYLKKQYQKDLVSNLVYFNKVGMFLTDIKKEDNIDFMNKTTTYRATFKDTNFQNHIIKFTVPKVDTDGTCLVNGNKKKLKIQRLNNPIVKVSPTRVTLNSIYNKCIVNRNTNVANDFFRYISKMLAKSTEKVDIQYTIQVINSLIFPSIELDDKYKKYFENNALFKLEKNLDFKDGEYIKTNFGFLLVIKSGEALEVLPTLNPKKICAEYCAIGNKISTITIGDDILIFNFEKRAKLIPKATLMKALVNENKYGVLFFFKDNNFYFLDVTGSVNIIENKKEDPAISTTTLIDLFSDLSKVTPTPLNEYCNVKVLNKNIPIAFILGYRFGLIKMLQYLNAPYEIYTKGTKLPNTVKLSDIKVKFMDKILIIKRVPVLNSLIFSGLNFFKFKDINLEEMEGRDAYFDLLVDKNVSPNILKGIDTFFDFFMDPITVEILFQMNEPTNFKDLLIRAVSLLLTTDHNESSSSENFRFRTYETFTATVHREMVRAYNGYRNKTSSATNKFSMKPNEIEKQISKSQIFNNSDTLNPIHDMKQSHAFTHVGDGGRSSASFVIDDRKFPKDGTGIISEATLDSGGVAMNAMMSVDPTIKNLRGLTISKPAKDVNPTELLSGTALLMAGATNDDNCCPSI